jgi:hypothetical protein
MMNSFVLVCAMAGAVSAQPCVEPVGSVREIANDSDAADGLVFVSRGVVLIFDLDGGFVQLSDPIGTFDPPGGNHNNLIISGDRLLVGRAGGVSVVDVSAPADPVLVSDLDVSNQIKDFEQAPNGTIFASAQVININPTGDRDSGVAAFSASGELLGVKGIDTANFSSTFGLAATDTAVYQARSGGGLWAIPFTGGGFGEAVLIPGTDGARDASAQGDYLYVSKGSRSGSPREGIVVFTGAGTTSLTEVGFVPLDGDGSLGELAASGDSLLATRSSESPWLFSIADPANPTSPVRLGADLSDDVAHWSDGLAFTSDQWFEVSDCAPPCTADFNGDGVLDLADINLFVSGFVGMDSIADLDGDGVFDLTDINLFVSGFTAGCP